AWRPHQRASDPLPNPASRRRQTEYASSVDVNEGVVPADAQGVGVLVRLQYIRQLVRLLCRAVEVDRVEGDVAAVLRTTHDTVVFGVGPAAVDVQRPDLLPQPIQHLQRREDVRPQVARGGL